MSKTPEGIVLEKCKDMLRKLENSGKILHWTRITVGDFYTFWGGYIKVGKKFEPDLWVFVPVDNLIWVMFFDTKRKEGGDDKQIVFFDKFKGFTNIVCAFITDPKQIKQAVENARKTSPNYGKIPDGVLPEFVG